MPLAAQRRSNRVPANSLSAKTARRLMLATSVSALSLAASEIILAPAHAQAVPSGCTDAITSGTPNDGDGVFDAGETITCLAPPDPISSITTNIEDLTIIVGDASTPTTAGDGTGGVGIRLTNGRTVNVLNSSSQIDGGSGTGISLTNAATDVDDLTITSEGRISGAQGVQAYNSGYGSVDVSVVDVSAVLAAINVGNGANGTDATFSASGLVQSTDGNAVDVVNNGSGSTRVYVDAVSAGSLGLVLQSGVTTTGDLVLTADGPIVGNAGGVNANQDGTGSVSVSVVDVTAGDSTYTSASGLFVSNDGVDLSIVSTGTITAYGNGIDAFNDGTGATTVSVGAVSSGGDGVVVTTNYTAAGDLKFTASGTIDAQGVGVSVDNGGTGSVSINVADVMAGNSVDQRNGLSVTNDGADLSIDSSGTITSSAIGVSATQNGTGATSVSVHDVTGNADGIDVYAATGSTGDVTVTSVGQVEGQGGHGVSVTNLGTGATVVNLVDVEASDGVRQGRGVGVQHHGTDVSVVTNGHVMAEEDGIHVFSLGTGATTISTNTVNAGSVGIYANAEYSSVGDLSVTAIGPVVAGTSGVRAYKHGTGTVSVNVGDVTAGGGGVAVSQLGTGAATVSVNNVNADSTGVDLFVNSNATGPVSITATGAITTTSSSGVQLSNQGSGDATISVNTIDADGIGVNANAQGAGDLSLIASGLITSSSAGVSLYHTGTGSIYANVVDVTSPSASVGYGISATSSGSDIRIISTGAVNALGGGVVVSNTGTGLTSVSVNNVNSYDNYAIRIDTGGNSAGTSVTTYGRVDSGRYSGIHIVNGGGDVNLSISGGQIYGGGHGIFVNNTHSADADTIITASGTIYGAGGDGVFLRHSGDATLSLSGTVRGIDDGIQIYGDNGKSVVSVGSVYGDTANAIQFYGGYGLTDVSITAAGLLSGGGRGVQVVNYGSGASTVSVNNLEAGGTGIYMYSGSATTGDVSVTAIGAISAESYGVQVAQFGSGSVSVTVADVTTGALTPNDGVDVYSQGADVSIVATGTITANNYGVDSRNRGTGSNTVSVNNIISNDTGLYVDSDSTTSGDVNVTVTGAITAETTGARLNNSGSGSLYANIFDVSVSGSSGYGVSLFNEGEDLTFISEGMISSASDGVDASNRGTGATSVSVHHLDVAGTGIGVFSAPTTTDNVTVTATGGISAGYRGIDINQDGSGDVIVSVGSVTAMTREAIYVEAAPASASNISVTSNGLLASYGMEEALHIDNSGSGDIVVNVTDVTTTSTGFGDHAIRIETTGGNVTLDATGAVRAYQNALDILQFSSGGAGSVDVSVHSLYSTAANAADIQASSNSFDVRFEATGLIEAVGSGVDVSHNGTGETFVSVNNVDAGETGIDVTSGAATTDLRIEALGDIEADGFGVDVANGGTGETTIIVNAVTTGGDGLEVRHNLNTTGDLTITANGAITAGADGVEFENYGTGDAFITVGDAIANNGAGINAYSASSSGLTTITSTGTISAYGNGPDGIGTGVFADINGAGVTIDAADIYGENDGVNISSDAGPITITANTVTGATDKGIAISNASSNAADTIAVNLAGAVTGAGSALSVSNSGGDTTLNLAGATGAAGNGISVTMEAGSTGSLDITSSDSVSGGLAGLAVTTVSGGDIAFRGTDVSGGSSGVSVSAFGPGDINVTATGHVSAAGGSGVTVEGRGSGSVTANVGSVTASAYGVNISQYYGGDAFVSTTSSVTAGASGVKIYKGGDGATTLDLDGDVVADDNGIIVQHASTGDIAISATGVSGGRNGIYAAGRGNIDITATGLVSAAGLDGIEIFSSGSGTETLTINTASISGGADGLEVNHYSDGDISFSASGDVNAGSIGVEIKNYGAGAVSVDVAGSVTGQTVRGVDVKTYGTDLSISVGGDVSAEQFGVRTRHDGFGATSLVLGGAVSSETAAALQLESDVGAITVEAAGAITSVDGAGVNIVANEEISLTAAGAVSAGAYGVRANNNGATGDITIDVADVSAGETGIAANINSSGNDGDIFVSSSGLVSAGDAGIRAVNDGTGSVTVDAVDIDSGATGILAVGYGSELTVNASGLIETANGVGVDVANSSFGATSISVADVVAGGVNTAIQANATDGLEIVSTGLIDGGRTGIQATHGGGADGVSISAVDVTGRADDGIFVGNADGSVSIATTGTVQGARDGIDVAQFGDGDVTINANNVYALPGDYGNAIDVRNFAANGAVSISTTGTVSSAALDGIHALNYGGDFSIISTGSVSGGYQGITAQHKGDGDVSVSVHNAYALAGGDDAVQVLNEATDGDLSITTTGVLTAADDDGIEANHYGAALSISTSGGAITGYQSGIEAYNYGTGPSTITISNSVTGETEIGVLAVSSAGTTLTIEEGGSVFGEIAALFVDGGTTPGDPADDILNLNEGGSISGDALLLAGDDVFNASSNQFTNVLGGDGTDIVNFAASAAMTIEGSGADGDTLQEFEVFNFNGGGFELAGAHVGLSATSFNAGTNTLSGSLTSTQTTIADGAILNASDGSVINGLLNVNGTLAIGDSPGVLSVDGDVVMGATSVLPVELSGDAGDLLTATGSVALDGELEIILLGGFDVGSTTRTIIDAGTGITGAFSSVASSDGLLITNTVNVDEANFDVAVTTTLSPASSVDGLNDNQTDVGDALVDLLGDEDLDPGLVEYIAGVGAISDVGALGSALSELSPEGFDAGLRFIAQSQDRFMSDLAWRSLQSPQTGPYVWGAIDLRHLSKNENAQNQGFKGDIREFSVGVSGLGGGPVQFGIAGGYATFNGETDAGLSDEADAKLYRLAASAHVPVAISGINAGVDNVFSFAAGENDLSMRISDPADGAPTVQSGEADIRSLGFTSRFTVTGSGNREFILQPYAEIGVASVNQDATFVGSDQPTALSVEEVGATRGHIGVGASFDRQVLDRLNLRASAAGMRYFGDTQNVIRSRFTNGPADASAFDTLGVGVEWKARLSAGASYDHKSGFTASVDGFGEAGDLNVFGARIEISREF